MTTTRRATPPRSEREVRAFVDIIVEALGFPGDTDAWLSRYDTRDVRVVRRNGHVAAGTWVLRFGQWFGGKSVPMAGIHGVGVAAEHRGQKLGSALMRSVVQELHDDGVPLSTLYPATQPIYRGVGYEQAGSWIHYRVPIDKIASRDRGAAVRRVGDAGLGELRGLYEGRAALTNGNLDRNEWAWQRAMRGWDGAATVFAVDGDAGPEGYIAFARRKVSPTSNRFDIRVRDLVASTPAAARRLLALVCDHASLGRDLIWTGPPGDPLFLHMREQNPDNDGSGGCDWYMRWMVRVVDVRKALAARGYSPAVRGRVDFDVRDDLLPANNGRFVLEVEDGEVRVRKGGRGELRIDVRGLASLYTSFLAPHQLAASGLVNGTDRALATAAAIFAGPSPWLVEIF